MWGPVPAPGDGQHCGEGRFLGGLPLLMGCLCHFPGVTAPAVPPRSPAKMQELGTRGTAVPGTTHPAGSTRPHACPPATGMVTKRPFAEGTGGAGAGLGGGVGGGWWHRLSSHPLARSGCHVPTGVWHVSWQLQRGEPAQEEVPWNEPPIPAGGPR